MNVLPIKVIYPHKSVYKRKRIEIGTVIDKTVKHTYKQAVNLFNEKRKNTEWLYSPFISKPFRRKSTQKSGGWILRDKNNVEIGWVGNRGDVTIYNLEYASPHNRLNIEERQRKYSRLTKRNKEAKALRQQGFTNIKLIHGYVVGVKDEKVHT